MNALNLRIDNLATISLDDLNAQASLMHRSDRKYVLDVDRAAEVVRRLSGARALEINHQWQFSYQSTYLDSPDLLSYKGAATRRRRRFKVRCRTYLDQDLHFWEVKTRSGRGATHKERIQVSTAATALDDVSADFISQQLTQAWIDSSPVDSLVPQLVTTYDRATLALRDGSRVTIDQQLRWSDPESDAVLEPQNLVIIETKTTGHPCEADRALWAMGHRPRAISKYATGMAATHPDLPSTRWSRLLRGLDLASPSYSAQRPLASATHF